MSSSESAAARIVRQKPQRITTNVITLPKASRIHITDPLHGFNMNLFSQPGSISTSDLWAPPTGFSPSTMPISPEYSPSVICTTLQSGSPSSQSSSPSQLQQQQPISPTKRTYARRGSTIVGGVKRKMNSPPPELQDPELADTTGKTAEELQRLQVRLELRRKLQKKMQKDPASASTSSPMSISSSSPTVTTPPQTSLPPSPTKKINKKSLEDLARIGKKEKKGPVVIRQGIVERYPANFDFIGEANHTQHAMLPDLSFVYNGPAQYPMSQSDSGPHYQAGLVHGDSFGQSEASLGGHFFNEPPHIPVQGHDAILANELGFGHMGVILQHSDSMTSSQTYPEQHQFHSTAFKTSLPSLSSQDTFSFSPLFLTQAMVPSHGQSLESEEDQKMSPPETIPMVTETPKPTRQLPKFESAIFSQASLNNLFQVPFPFLNTLSGSDLLGTPAMTKRTTSLSILAPPSVPKDACRDEKGDAISPTDSAYVPSPTNGDERSLCDSPTFPSLVRRTSFDFSKIKFCPEPAAESKNTVGYTSPPSFTPAWDATGALGAGQTVMHQPQHHPQGSQSPFGLWLQTAWPEDFIVNSS
ncbi:hypothetical protein HDU97_003384 [Phlyctochytrium planicorne]|nr:hypothetical protein HDU97_003384 [Phlyctochytrium planicorne]